MALVEQRTPRRAAHGGRGKAAPLATLEASEAPARGREARRSVPRSAHGEWEPSPRRPDPVAILAAQAASRVQELVPIRYGRMLVSPFTFYRGAAAVMAADLAETPDSGIVVQACGDAHISNFGAFAAPDRRLIFSPNDFDETLPGPWEWDVKRMAASAEIAGRDIGLPAARRRWIVTECVKEYRQAMRAFARVSHLDVWYERLNAERTRGALRRTARARGTDPVLQAVRQGAAQDEPSRAAKAHRARRTASCDSDSAPPLLVPFRELYEASEVRQENAYIYELLDQYAASLDPDRRHLFATYRFVDMARKVVGVGSVGTRAWVFLFVGPPRPGPAGPAGEGGSGVRARALSRRERVLQPRRAGRAGAADLAGRQRHLPRAGSAAAAWTVSSTTSTSASCGTGRPRPTSRR